MSRCSNPRHTFYMDVGRSTTTKMAGKDYKFGPLVAQGLMEPGKAVLSCSVSGKDHFADLGTSGEILFNGEIFTSPSAFSVYIKRLHNPKRMADDGWTSVRYKGEPISRFRDDTRQNLADRDARAATAGPSSVLTASPLRGSHLSRQRKPKRSRGVRHGSYDDSTLASPSGEESGFGGSIGPDGPSSIHGDENWVDQGRTSRQSRPQARSPGLARPALYENEAQHYTWIQCEEKPCGKWRKVSPEYAQNRSRPWACGQSVDPEYASCEVAQEASDAHVMNCIHARHMMSCSRRSLEQMTEEEFLQDLVAFLTERNELDLAKQLTNKRVTCNNRPLDIFNLYREVMRRGGFLENEQYDQQGRWKGRINFAGEIFKKLTNFTENNKATSVGNQLMSNYKKFLLAYEVAHSVTDLPNQQRAKTEGLDLLAAAGIAEGAENLPENPPMVESQLRSSSARVSRPPKRWVDEPTNERRVRQRVKGNGLPLSPSLHQFMPPSFVPVHSIQLATDSTMPSQYWPVIVLDPLVDLPLPVTYSEPYHTNPAIQFPPAFVDPDNIKDVEENGGFWPVMVMGTQSIGFLEAASCRELNADRADSAYKTVIGGLSNSLDTQEKLGHEARHAALKLALQLHKTSASNKLLATKSLVEAGGVKAVAKSLLALEGRLPYTESQDFMTWEGWRDDVQQARTAAQLARQAVFLFQHAQQFLNFDKGRQLAATIPSLMGIPSGDAPTVTKLSQAVFELEDAISWRVIRQPTPSAGHMSPCITEYEPVPNASMTGFEGLHMPHSASVTNLAAGVPIRGIRTARTIGKSFKPRSSQNKSRETPERRRGTSPLTFATNTPAQPALIDEDRVSLTPRSRATNPDNEEEVAYPGLLRVPELESFPVLTIATSEPPRQEVELKPTGPDPDQTPVFSRIGMRTSAPFDWQKPLVAEASDIGMDHGHISYIAGTSGTIAEMESEAIAQVAENSSGTGSAGSPPHDTPGDSKV
eukprot:jgi/Botrbrau1/14894/Bobra.0248s0011.2